MLIYFFAKWSTLWCIIFKSVQYSLECHQLRGQISKEIQEKSLEKIYTNWQNGMMLPENVIILEKCDRLNDLLYLRVP